MNSRQKFETVTRNSNRKQIIHNTDEIKCSNWYETLYADDTDNERNLIGYPAGNYMFKVNNRNTRLRCEICSKLTIKISLLLTLNILYTLFKCFFC